MPPVAPPDNLPDSWVIITSTNIKLEETRAVFWLHLSVLTIQNFKEFLDHLHID